LEGRTAEIDASGEFVPGTLGKLLAVDARLRGEVGGVEEGVVAAERRRAEPGFEPGFDAEEASAADVERLDGVGERHEGDVVVYPAREADGFEVGAAGPAAQAQVAAQVPAPGGLGAQARMGQDEGGVAKALDQGWEAHEASDRAFEGKRCGKAPAQRQ